MSQFVHLHVHTRFSFMESTISIQSLLEKAVELDMPAVAITDHGNMFGAIEFYRKALELNIEPIVGGEINTEGCTARENDNPKKYYHMVLLAETNEGYRNLCHLVSRSKPYDPNKTRIVPWDDLLKYNKGLIALSGCIYGEINQNYLKNGIIAAEETALKLADVFDNDRFYLEVQANGLTEQTVLNKTLSRISKKTGIPLVATNDCHYLTQKDSWNQYILMCMNAGKALADPDRPNYATDQCYFKSPEEMEEHFPDSPEAISNTLRIAERCNVDLELPAKPLTWDLPSSSPSEKAMLAELAMEGLRKRLAGSDHSEERIAVGLISDLYRERIASELEKIDQVGAADKFLFFAGLVGKAKEAGFPVGPGYGNGPGSLALWCLGVIEINPIEHGLLFERFWNTLGPTQGDIRVIFGDVSGKSIQDFLKECTSSEEVVGISEFESHSTEEFFGKLSNIMGATEEAFWQSLEGLTEDEKCVYLLWGKEAEIKSDFNPSTEIKQIIDIGTNFPGYLTSVKKDHGTQVILDRSAAGFLSTWNSEDGEKIAQCGYPDIEYLDLTRLHIHREELLDITHKAIQLINKNRKAELTLDAIPLDDEVTMELFKKGDTEHIAGFCSKEMRKYLKHLDPLTFTDLVCLFSLYRECNWEKDYLERFIEARHSPPETQPIRDLGPILDPTHSVIVFQEQIMMIARKIGGYTLEGADIFRRELGKKNPDVIERHRIRFINTGIQRSIPWDHLSELFEKLLFAADYAFPKCHGVSMTLMAWQAVYLKAHFREEFLETVDMITDRS